MSNTRSNRFSRLWMLLFVVFVVVAVPIGWYLFSPIFFDQTVDESFPAVVAPIQATAVATDTDVAAPVSVDVVSDPTSVASAESETTVATVTAVEAELLPILNGAFVDGESRYAGSGSAVIYELADGQRVLRFEDFEVTNGPDLFVYLSGHPAPLSGEELHTDAVFELARLKGNVGNQNYELPADLDLSAFQSVVIYCKRFSVVFSMAAFGG